jgi:hypothetical protein
MTLNYMIFGGDLMLHFALTSQETINAVIADELIAFLPGSAKDGGI